MAEDVVKNNTTSPVKEKADRVLLQEFKSELTNRILYTGVLDELISMCVVLIDEREEIVEQKHPKECNTALLDLLGRRSYPTFLLLADALEASEPYNPDVQDLVQRIRKNQTNTCTEQEERLHPDLQQVAKLHKNYKFIVHGLESITIIDHLLHTHCIDQEEYEIVIAQRTTIDRNRKIIDIISKKGRHGYIKFLEALRADAVYKDLADQIDGSVLTPCDIFRINTGAKDFHTWEVIKGMAIPSNIYAYPGAISRMDEDSRKLYKKVLESGYEVKREIRVIVVGRKGAGKTCLTRRLRSKPIDDVKETNGIEIHSIICKDDNITDDTTWHEKTQSADSRLLTCTKLTEKETQVDPRIVSDDGNEAIFERLRQTDEEQEALIPSGSERTEESMNLDKQSTAKGQGPVSTDTDKDINIDQDIKDMTNAMENDENDIRIHVWDFGGDDEFYYTHQLFLAENVIFLIVTSLENSDVSSDKEFRFWFDTIHCLCTDPKSHTLKPQCIVVGTKTDLCENEKAADDIFGKKLQSVPGTLRDHIYGKGFLISNKKTYDQAIKDIKTAIISAAKKNTEWESKHPVRFILLDKALDKKRRELEKRPIITRSDIQSINEGLHQPLTKDELELYLRYNHLAGHLIYYEDIPDYIIIVPQWLSELFRCIVTADKFRPSQLPKHDLKTLRSTGQLTGNLLRDIFHIKDVEAELQSYLMQVLEKFQIVIEVSHSNEDRTKKYFAPCMVSDKIFDATIFAGTVKEKSTWLCLECDFLPPFLFNQIVIFFCKKYLPAKGKNVYPEFYSDGAVIEISPHRCENLVVLRLRNVIQLQIIMLGRLRKPQQCREVKSLLTKKITELLQTYSLRIEYEYKWKCPESSHNCSRLLELNACSEGEEYCCDTCTDDRIHIFHNYWDENLQQSALSKEELNFTRLAMLVTEVLADALHDLLPIPKAIARNQCDVTSLYQKHRNLNTHTPSSGRWGGVQTVNDIPATSILVGDDIERCRVIRNRLNHSPHYRIPDNEINDVYLIIHEVLTRLYAFIGLSSTPTYMDRAEEIKRKTYAVADKEVIKEKLNRETSIHNYNAEKIEVHHHHHYK